MQIWRWYIGAFDDFQILFIYFLLCKKYQNVRCMFSHKNPKESDGTLFKTYFLNILKKTILKKTIFETMKLLYISFYCFTHTFTFQLLYLITPRWRWQIILGLHQIWTQSEKCAIASEQSPWARLSDITGLLADSGCMTSNDFRWREGL